MYTINEEELRELLTLKEYCIRQRNFIIYDEDLIKWKKEELPKLLKSYWFGTYADFPYKD